MNILVCSEPFDLVGSVPSCPGDLTTVAYIQNPAGAGLTWEEVKELQDGIVVLFSLVFGFLVLKKLL